MILLMTVKKAVYYLLAAGPFLIIGLIAIHARYRTNHWDFVEYGPETSRRIAAYIAPVTAVRTHLRDPHSKTPDALQSALDAWLKASRRGDLKDIPPPTAENEGTTPVYEQILAARQLLAEAAMRQADKLREAGELSAAAFLYADVMEVANTAKFSEFASLADAQIYQVTALQNIEGLASHLGTDDRAALLGRIEALDSDPMRTLTHVVDRFSVAYNADLQRVGKPVSIMEAARDRLRLASNDDPVLVRIEGLQQMSVSDQSLMALYGRTKVAYTHYERYKAQLAATIEALDFGLDVSSN